MLRRLFVNTSSSLVTMVISMTITFIMAPIYVKTLGHYDYGLREMVMSVVGYMGMLSLGMQPTTSRFAALYNAQKDRNALLTVYATSLVFLFLVGLLLATVFWIWAFAYPESIMPEGSSDETKYFLFLIMVGINLLIAFPKNVAVGYLEGFHRYYLKNNINIIGSVLMATISYHYITPENGLLLLVGLNGVIAFTKLIIFGGLLLRPAYGAIYPNLRFFSLDKLKEMLGFGLKSFIQGAATKIESTSDRLVIGTMLGPSFVPVYTVPASLVNYLQGVTQTLTHAFMPLFSDLSARGQNNRIRRIYMMASKLVVGFVVPAAVGAVAIGGPFIHIWMDGEFERELVDSIILLLVLFIAVPRLNPFASRYLTAIGQHGIFAKVAPVAALANLLSSIWLVSQYGVIGAAIGSVFPVFVVTPIFLKYSCAPLGVPVREYVSKVILPTVIPSIVMGITVFWIRGQWGLDSYTEILACIGIGAVVYSILYWLISFQPDEKDFLFNLVRTKFR